MAEKKTIAVLGATGAQGGGVVRSLYNDPEKEYTIRAITRNPESEKAQALTGVADEIVAANTGDTASLEKAFDGAYGVFAVTNFWEDMDPKRESRHIRNIAQAAKNAGVEHVVWSTLEDTRNWVPLDDDRMPTLQGEYKCPHYDCKGEVDHVFTDLGVPTTFLMTSFYWDNFIHFGMGPAAGPDGVLAITFPLADKKLPGMAVQDIGKSAAAIFKQGDKFIGKRIGIAGQHLTGQQMADTFTKVLGKEVRYNAVPPEVYRGFGFPGAEDLGNMFQFKAEFEDYYCGVRNLDEARKLNPELLTFEQWVTINKDRIPIG